jgi:hypothetical protein
VTSRFAESVVEEAALAWLAGLGWQIKHGPGIAQGEPGASAPTRPIATSFSSSACVTRWHG